MADVSSSTNAVSPERKDKFMSEKKFKKKHSEKILDYLENEEVKKN